MAADANGEPVTGLYSGSRISKPKFIVCDEPTPALDLSMQARMLSLIKQLRRYLA